MNSFVMRTPIVLISSAVLSVLLVWLAFGDSLRNTFLHWDDRIYLHANTYLHALTPENLLWMVSENVGARSHYNWQPLTALSHALDIHFHGFDAAMHRLGNLALHAVAGVAVFAVAWQLGQRAGWYQQHRGTLFVSALFAMALFLVHPLRTESVVWVAERKDVLCGAFYLLAVAAWLRAQARSSLRWRIVASCCGAAACLAKPMAVSLSVVLVMLDYWPYQRWSWRPRGWRSLVASVVRKLDFVGYALVTSIMAILAQEAGGALRSLDELSLTVRILNAAHSILLYPGLTAMPVDLTTLYPYPQHVLAAGWLAWSELGVVLLVTVVVIGFAAKGQRQWLTLWLVYLVSLLPVLGIVQVGMQSAADRYTYLPLVGLAVMISAVWMGWLHQTQSPPLKTATKTSAVAFIVAWAVMSRAQAALWFDDRSLWEHTLALYPEELPIVHVNLGNVEFREGNMEAADKRYRTALELDPDSIVARTNLAWTSLRLKRFDAALAFADDTIRLDQDSLQGWLAKAVASQLSGRNNEAVSAYRRVLELNPGNPDAVRNLDLLGAEKSAN